MLKLCDLIENFELAEEVLSYWEYDIDSLEECFQYFRISSNAIYPFRRNGVLCFLRFAPVTEKRYDNLKGELKFIQYLRSKEYPALEPIPAKNDELILTVATKWGDYYASAFYGVPGEAIEETSFSRDICFAYGKQLGRLHKLSSEYAPATRKQTHDDILDLIEHRLHEFQCDSTLKTCLATLRQNLSCLPKDRLHYGLVHYDFECDNVFFDADTGNCHVIDFEDGMYHFYGIDLVQAMDSIREEAPVKLYEEAVGAFLDGYRTEFCYDEVVEAAMPTLRTFRDLYSYARNVYCVSGMIENAPEWMVNLAKILNEKNEMLQSEIWRQYKCLD